MITNEVAGKIDELVDNVALRLKSVEDDVASARPGEGKWSMKEIIGHLMDSAANNHQRFVRAPAVGELKLPGYDQDEWVSRQNYQETDWPLLLELWRLYNHHVAHVIRQIPEERLYTVCRIGEYEPCTLRFVVEDYVDHMNHHLKQVNIQAAG
jgi:DinB superfamily